MSKQLKDIVRNNLKTILQEQLMEKETQQKPKKEKKDTNVPEGCFGGPKKYMGALVSLIQQLMKEHDRNGERAVEELKRFMEGKTKPDPKEMVQILEKYGKHKYIGYAGCF